MKASEITDDQFYQELVFILDSMRASEILSVPGVYEILAEEFNNEIIDNILSDTEEN